MNAKIYRMPVVIDRSLVLGDLVFATHRDRCLYIGTSIMDRQLWLEEHAGDWRRIEDVQREAVSPAPPAESEIGIGPALARPNSQMSSRDVRKGGDAEDNAALVDARAGDCSPPHEPASPPTALTEPIANETMEAELPSRAKVEMSEGTGSKTETTPLKAMRRKPGRSGGRKLKKQKLPAEVAKAGRKLSPERIRRMLIVIESLRERPILSYAASKAGIHRKTLAYWIKRSKAGDDGYDIKSQGEILRFHEHCEAAIGEARDKVLAAAHDIAMGGVVYKYDEHLLSLGHRGSAAYLRDDNGTPVVETVRNKNPKMLRFLLEWLRPEKWGKPRKIDVPRTGGVLVIGGGPKKPDTSAATAASLEVRKWKAAAAIVRKAKS